jgi:hypothetical protein
MFVFRCVRARVHMCVYIYRRKESETQTKSVRNRETDIGWDLTLSDNKKKKMMGSPPCAIVRALFSYGEIQYEPGVIYRMCSLVWIWNVLSHLDIECVLS